MRELDGAGLEGYIAHIGAEGFFTPELTQRARLLEYEPGEQIMTEGGEVRSLMILVSGTARISSLSPEGKLAVIAEARPPHLLGDIEYLQNRPVLHDVYAKGAVRLISVPVYALGGEMESLNFYRLVCSSLMRKLYNTSSAYSRALLYPAKKPPGRVSAGEFRGWQSVYEGARRSGAAGHHAAASEPAAGGFQALRRIEALRREDVRAVRCRSPDGSGS